MDKDDSSQEWLTRPSGYFRKSSRGKVVTIPRDHPYYRTSNKGNIAESRLVMAEHLGRNLTDNDTVSFKDGDNSNSRIENLILLSVKEFAAIHIYKRLVSQLDRINSKISTYKKRILSYGIDPDTLERSSPTDRYWEIDRDREAAERAGGSRWSDREE